MKIERIETPIATGERLVTQHAFREVLEKRACSVLQPDITHCGGLSEARRIAATPFFSPPSGLATGSFNGLHAKSKFLAFAAILWACGAAHGAAPLKDSERKQARELYSNRGCIGCHMLPQLTQAPNLIDVSKKYAATEDGLKTIATSLVTGAKGKWGKMDMPPQTHLQPAERELLTRWVLGLHESGESLPGTAELVDGFDTPEGFDARQWSQYEYWGRRAAAVQWSREGQSLLLRSDGGGVAGFYRTGLGRASSDLVTVTVKDVHGQGTAWGQVGLMISSVAQPSLFDTSARYEWLIRRETDVPGWVYRVRKDVGGGNYELYSSDPVDATGPVKLDIVRKGDKYEFYANGRLHYTTGANPHDTYAAATLNQMTHFGFTLGGGAAMTATIDDLTRGIPIPEAVADAHRVADSASLFIEKRNGAIIEVLGRPVVYRTYLPDAPARAIAVGLPGGLCFGFDAQHCRLLYAWRGGFLDVSQSWTGYGGWYSKLLGAKFYTAPSEFPLRIGDPAKEPDVKFKGYDLEGGYPVFKYVVDGCAVRHRIEINAKDGAPAITHRFRLDANAKPVFFVIGNDKASYESDDAEWGDGRWKVQSDHLKAFSITVTP
jgi:cytochrome c551/c552